MVSFSLACITTVSFACSKQPEFKTRVHNVSEIIEAHSNFTLINESLYKQKRPRINITNNKLSENQIDAQTRKYVSENYTPTLFKNYSQIYSELKEMNKDFSKCDDIVPIKENDDVLKSLCLEEENDVLKVIYMTNGYSRG